MSVHIGQINPKHHVGDVDIADVHVLASRAGVELHSEPQLTLDPVQARNYAALLQRAADEVERMRVRNKLSEEDCKLLAAPECHNCGEPHPGTECLSAEAKAQRERIAALREAGW